MQNKYGRISCNMVNLLYCIHMIDAYICYRISDTTANTSILTIIVLIIRELHVGDLWKFKISYFSVHYNTCIQ